MLLLLTAWCIETGPKVNLRQDCISAFYNRYYYYFPKCSRFWKEKYNFNFINLISWISPLFYLTYMHLGISRHFLKLLELLHTISQGFHFKITPRGQFPVSSHLMPGGQTDPAGICSFNSVISNLIAGLFNSALSTFSSTAFLIRET